MTSHDRLLAHQLNLEGLTLGEIGSKLGVTRQRVHQILQPPRHIFNAIMARTRGRCECCGIRARPVHIHAHEAEREINGEIVSIEADDIWRDTFAHWDSLIDTDTAAVIATATERIIRVRWLI